MTSVQAATNANATKAIDNLQTKSGYQKGYRYGGDLQCYGFARKVYTKLFGMEMGSQNKSTYYSINNPSMYVVGQLKGAHSLSEIKALLMKASPGDVLTYRTTCAWTHTAIVEAVDSTGITLYHYTDDDPSESINYSVKITKAYWSKSVNADNWYAVAWIGQLTSSSHGMTLYHAKNYDELYGSAYSIKHNANGGTGSVATSSVTYGTDFTIAKSGFTRAGYALAGYNVYRSSDKRWYTTGGWATAAEITSGGYTKKQYSPGATYTLDYSWTRGASAGDTYTFYAVWKQSAFNIAYNANGGTGTMASSTINSGGILTIPECSYTRDGYYFLGYNVLRQSDSGCYIAGKGWFTSSVLKNNGYKKRLYTPGEALTFDNSWTNGATAGDTYTFYAIWGKNNPSLNFYNNYSGANYIASGITEGELFEKSFISRDESVYTLSIDSTERLNNQNSLKIVGKAAGSSGKDMAFMTDTNQGCCVWGGARDDKQMTLSFWAKSSVNGAKMYLRWGYTSDYQTITLTTSWKKYTVDMSKNLYDGNVIHPYFDTAGTFYINNLFLRDGSTSEIYRQESTDIVDTISYDYGSTYGKLPTAERAGYTFKGWYTAKVGGTQITADTQVLPDDTNVYAHWEQDFCDASVGLTYAPDGRVYELYDNALSWEEAKAHCESLGGHLVTINSAEENELVHSMISDDSRIAWIGAYFDTETGAWRWVTDEEFDYTNWASGEPTNSEASPEPYAHMHPCDIGTVQVSATWNDMSILDSWTSHYAVQNSSYICEYEPGAYDDPNDPEDPDDPEDPEIPTDPEDPDDPENPDVPVDPEEIVAVYFYNSLGWKDPYICYYDGTEEITYILFMDYVGVSAQGDVYSAYIPSDETEFWFGTAESENMAATVSVVGNPVDGIGYMPSELNEDSLYDLISLEYEDGAFGYPDEPQPTPVLKGDVNGDGEVDIGDAVVVSRYSAGFLSLDSVQLITADVNGDGEVDIGDAVVISRYSAGFITSIG